MRIIIYGVGAVGGTVAAALAQAGHEVVGIARGAMLDAIQSTGLRLRTPARDLTQRFDCVAHPSEIVFRDGDAILLCMKTQDTLGALHALRDAGVADQPIFCLQNGVANERMALRLFPNVYGVTVMLPAQYLTPGEVAVTIAPKFGMFYMGRAPSGTDAADTALSGALNGANFVAVTDADVMATKYGKLRVNLGNVLQAAIGRDITAVDAGAALRAEFDAVMDAMGQRWIDVGADPRWKEYGKDTDVPGITRVGGSTLQSLMRGAASLEVDYLNGEVALLGRLHGVATPANANAVRLAAHLVAGGAQPSSLSLEALNAAIFDGDLPT